MRQVLVSHAVERLLVIGTYRDSEVDADHPLADLFARLHREQGVERLSLRGLGDDELLVWLEMIARDAAIYVALLFVPLGFVSMIWPATS